VGGNKRRVNLREIVNVLLYVLSTGGQWAAIPKDLPPRSTVCDYFDLWDRDDTLMHIHEALKVACREREQRDPSLTVAIFDSQSMKSAEKGGGGSTRLAMRPQKDQRQKAPYSRRYTGLSDAGPRSPGSCARP
jgi:transposase